MTSAAPAASTIAKGILKDVVAPTALQPGYIVFTIPGTSYQLHLRPQGDIRSAPGQRIKGSIRCQARRVDRSGTGGRFVEPVFGRPRRLQGTVIGHDTSANAIIIDAGGSAVPGFDGGLPITCVLSDARQKPGDFQVGDLVGFDVFEGATFTQA